MVVINSMLSESLLPATPKRAPTASLAQWLTLVASLASLTLAVIALWRTEALERARPSVKATLTPRYRASLLQTAESDARWTPFDPDPTRLRWIRFSSGANVDGLPYLDAFGQLTVPLVHGDPNSPELELQVILRRYGKSAGSAVNRTGTTPRGVLLGHCGGPGSDAACAVRVSGVYVTDTHGDETAGGSASASPIGFDVLGISQRGVEPNTPGMTCPSITGAEPRLPSDPKTLPPRLADISNNCECAFLDGSRAGYMFKDIDTYDEAAVRSVYTLTRAAADRCYNASYWQLLGKDGQTRFHFLEHVGTQALVHDLEVLRVALGLERYSIYGSSYGTMVGAVYASVFPSRVDSESGMSCAC